MKQIFRLLFLLLIHLQVNAQSGSDSTVVVVDTAPAEQKVVDTVVKPRRPAVRPVFKKTDTLTLPAVKKDSPLAMAAIVQDSVALEKPAPLAYRGESYKNIILKNPLYNFGAAPMPQLVAKREAGRESQFYLLCGLILFFALVRTLFGKYLQNLFAVFFRISMKQKQLREQLVQMPLPSLLLNLLFIFTGGIYAAYLLKYYGIFINVNQWLLLLYCAGILALIYLVKLLVLKLTGWVFHMEEATDTYIFVVFLVNKLLGIFLMPVIVLIAFADPMMVSVVITLSYILIFAFFSYRYLISYTAVRKEIKVSPFHFFLYLCAFELIPLVLIYKVLLEFVYRSP